MKKLVSVLTAAVLLLCLCACGAAPEVPKPEDTVVTFSEGMKDFDFEKMQGSLFSSEENIQSEISDLESRSELAAMFTGKIREWAGEQSYEIVRSETNGETATVEAKYSYVDSSPIVNAFFTEYVTRALALAMQNATEEEIEAVAAEILSDKIQTGETGTTERTVTYTLKMENGAWKIINLPDDVMHIMTADFVSALEQVASALGG